MLIFTVETMHQGIIQCFFGSARFSDHPSLKRHNSIQVAHVRLCEKVDRNTCKIESDGGKHTQRKAKDQENKKAGERNVVKSNSFDWKPYNQLGLLLQV